MDGVESVMSARLDAAATAADHDDHTDVSSLHKNH